MAEIVPGLYHLQVSLPIIPLGYTNVYLVRGDDGYLLLDTGWDNEYAFQSLKKQLAEIRVDIKDISRIIVTHSHVDHHRMTSRLKQLSGAEICLHQLEKDMINVRELNASEFRQQSEQWLHRNGMPSSELPPAGTLPGVLMAPTQTILPDTTFNGGEIITAGNFSFQVIWTPGHSPGHICLYEPTHKLLMTGDHILPVINSNVSFQPHSSPNPLKDFLDSLDQLKRLDVNIVLPAHEYFFTDLPKRIEEIIQHHQKRSSDILGTIKTEAKTAYQIATEIKWMLDFGGVPFQDLPPGDKRMAVGETLAHLEFLTLENRVNKFDRDSLIYYQGKM
jgi:glyoxylase-like metal-dependent hydrolase (beta-lactamase superfamily II)